MRHRSLVLQVEPEEKKTSRPGRVLLHMSGLDYGTGSLADMRAFVRGNSMMAPAVGGEEEEREMRREEEEVLWRTGVTAQVLSLLALLVQEYKY